MLLGLNNLVNRIRKGYEKVEKWKIDHPNVVGKVPNPFFYFNGSNYINVYTTESDFESPYSGVREYDYRELGENYSKWIEETQRKLLANRTSHERKFSQILSQSKVKVVEQPYFKINDKGYFLDFYIPQYNLAFELNGKVHKGEEREFYDADRDWAFHSIGIKTIRVSNLDIDSDDIKIKINEWAKLAISGYFDPALYYRRSNTRKFDGKETTFEKLHKRINNIISKGKYTGKSVLIVSSHTYFCSVLSEKRYNTSGNINKKYIDEFFDIIEINDVKVGIYFSGNTSNMGVYRQESYVDSNNNATKRKIDYQITIDGNDIKEEKYKYKDVHPVQHKTGTNKKGEEYWVGDCPYGMFFPYKKEGVRKHRYKTYKIVAGGNLCSICQFCKGNDEEKGLTLCVGFLNEGSKNIYDNLNADNPNAIPYLKYKYTDEYSALMKIINEIERIKQRRKIKYTQYDNRRDY